MIEYCSGDVYQSKENIIFNPVGVRDNHKGFITRVKIMYPEVYEFYKDMAWSNPINKLLGDVQLVRIREEQFILNGFCIEKYGRINKQCLSRNLVELCNLACEYHISVGLEYCLGSKDEIEQRLINNIMKVTFADIEIPVRIYRRNN